MHSSEIKEFLAKVLIYCFDPYLTLCDLKSKTKYLNY